MNDFTESLPPPLEFFLGDRCVTAKKADLLDPNSGRTVYRLELTDSPSLPSIVILKKQKPWWEDQFNTEKKAYNLLSRLQGTVIPIFYGEAIYDRSPALVLSAISGTTLLELARGGFPQSKEVALEAKIVAALQAFVKYGVQYNDERLDNFLLADDDEQVKIVDLEHVNLSSTKLWPESFNYHTAECLMYKFTIARDPLSLPPLDPRAWSVMEDPPDTRTIDIDIEKYRREWDNEGSIEQ
ncbi:unnamed protein product [Penicillium salamii]|uniref:Protein kinase domain-containing protein n=1 Tax=Penicillium salamii TaxID=1612424 RepID=A0A9W4JV39_9EURO|nr:unnamed protein product [Penicillium salamii]CAG8397270.1 unnamed protein product [Penicillium salamii]CAG8416427.1 unnamed protein product [Penicillium salamii]CAG8421734.1 unnamed protein product [Penicillium salamii]